MPRNTDNLLTKLTLADMKKLLKFKESIDKLEAKKVQLAEDLGKIDADLLKVLAAAAKLGSGRRGKKPGPKPGKKKAGRRPAKNGRRKVKARKAVKRKVSKKAAKKTTARKAATKSTARKKTTAKKTRAKKTRAKAGAKKTTRRASGKKQPTLESVVINLIAKKGGKMSYKDILSTITTKKLFVSKSSNFDNVLRRTISTSKKIKRVARGVYGV